MLGDDAVGFLKEASSADQPFFMHLAFNAPHDPRQSPAEYVNKYPLERIKVPRELPAGVPLQGCHWVWEHQIQTTLWLGISEGPSEFVFVIPERRDSTGPRIAVGMDIHVPLNDSVALFGEANCLTPSDSGTVDVYLGFAYYPRGTGKRQKTNRYTPMLPIASNPSFIINARQ